ncbi:hypothetical protein OG288_12315 [Streptomyces tauricus]|uniref:CPBP family intramembrane metalloprotease n=1 Tax=Streptomyces tauricus TaxID=68274 RepID=A0ABZ1JGZ5_9ACTN|nr:hypothetical protein [Streptomyces tauricus]
MPEPATTKRIKQNFRVKDLLPPRGALTFPAASTPPFRVLAELAGLLFLVCFAGLANGVVIVAGMYGVRWEPQDLRWIDLVQVGCAAVASVWLVRRELVRSAGDHVPQWQWWRFRAAMALGLATVCTAIPDPSVLHRDVGPALFGCVTAWLAVEVCRAHQVWPDSRLPATAARRLDDWKIGGAGVLACYATGLLFALLVVLFREVGPEALPVMQGSQMSSLGIAGPVGHILAIVHAVLIEDVVVVVATVVLMKAVRRPTWEIYTVVCVLEIALHAYFGIAAIGAVAFAAGRVWLYLRYRRLLPLMLSHAVYDGRSLVQWLPGNFEWATLPALAALYFLIELRLEKAAGKGTSSAPSPLPSDAAAGNEARTP